MIDNIDSADALQRFMEREGINCPEHPHDLLPHEQLKRHTDSFAREIIEGARQLTIDLLAIPLDSQPGRKTAVRLFTRVENRVRELRGESTKAPFYPYDSYYLLTYLDHISIWQPRIEGDASKWLTDWNRRKAQLGDETVTSKLMATPYFRSSVYGHLDMFEAVGLVRNDAVCRIEFSELLLRSYMCYMTNVPDSYSTADPAYKDTDKMLVVEAVKSLMKRGINPFDILYGMGEDSFKRKRKVAEAVFLAMMVFALILIMYACVNEIDI